MARPRNGSGSMTFALERRVALIGTFLTNDPSKFIFSELRNDIKTNRGIETILRLNYRRLGWGDRNQNSYGNLYSSSIVPYCSVSLNLVREMFSEIRYPNVLLCIIKTINQTEFRYEIVSFRLLSESEVRLYLDLFAVLTQNSPPPDAVMTPRDRTQPRAVTRNNGLYSPPMSTHDVRNKQSTVTLRKSNPVNVTQNEDDVDGDVHVVRLNGVPRRKSQYNTVNSVRTTATTADSVRTIGERQRHSERRDQDARPRSIVLLDDGYSTKATKTKRRSVNEPNRHRMDGTMDRRITTRSIGVEADLEPQVRRQRSRGRADFDDGVTSQHVRMYSSENGVQMGDVFCQTNLDRVPIRSSSDDSETTVRKENRGIARKDSQGGQSRRKENGGGGIEGRDEIDSAAVTSSQESHPNLNRRMTLVDNGVVKVTVEEYQDMVATPTDDDRNLNLQSPPVNTGNKMATLSPEMRYDHKDGNNANGVYGRTVNRNRRLDTGYSTRRMPSASNGLSPPIYTTVSKSTIRRTTNRPTVYEPAFDNERVLYGSQPVYGTASRPSYKEERGYPLGQNQYRMSETVYQSRPVQRSSTMSESVYQQSRYAPSRADSSRRNGRFDVYRVPENEYGWRNDTPGPTVVQTRRSTVYSTRR